MNSLLALLLRHGLAAGAGFFAAHQIDGSSTTGLIIGLIMFLISIVWSWGAKLLHLEDTKGEFSGNQALRTLAGALASQLVAAASTYFAIDADNPELLGVALLNAGLSKAGLHQKLAGLGSKESLKLLLLASLGLGMLGCTTAQKAEAIAFGQRVAVSAGEAAVMIAEIELAKLQGEHDLAVANGAPPREVIAKKLALNTAKEALKAAKQALAKERAKLDKQPLDVQPGGTSNSERPTLNIERNDPPASDEPREEIPRCLQITVVHFLPVSSSPRLIVSPSLAGSGTPQLHPHPETSARVLRPPAIPFPRLGEAVAQHLAQTDAD